MDSPAANMPQLSHLVTSVEKFDIKCVFTHQGTLSFVLQTLSSFTGVFDDGVFCKIQNLLYCSRIRVSRENELFQEYYCLNQANLVTLFIMYDDTLIYSNSFN